MQERKLFTAHKYRQCCEIYEREKLQNLELYPGVRDTLDKLKTFGLKLAIITDADRCHALSRLTRVELMDSFDILVAADMTGTKKPDPAHFLFALQALGIKPEESLVVGDSIRRDIPLPVDLDLKLHTLPTETGGLPKKWIYVSISGSTLFRICLDISRL